MYAPFFGLGREPFSIAPDPRFLFMSERHREALAHLLYGLDGGGGFVLLTGEIGAGKTTVARCFLEQLPAHCSVAYIFNPRLSARELLQTVCSEFGIELPDDPRSIKAHVDALNRYLLDAHAQGRQALLVIDEAQSLPTEVLEQLRLLTNLETSERKLLQIVLIGQPELREMLARPRLEQLAQRVIARYHLGPLTRAETRQYIDHRLAVARPADAGAVPTPFDTRALARMHQLTGGVPRRINLLAGRALLGAYAQGRRQVDERMLQQAAREVFDRDGPPARPRWGWWGAAAVVALAGVAGLGAWAWQWTAATAPTARLGPATAASAALAASAAAATTATAAAASASAAAVAASAAAAAPRPASDPAALLAAAHTDEATAWRDLALRWNVAIGEGEPCRAAAQAQLACLRSAAGGLALVRQLGRPGWLALRGERPQADGIRRPPPGGDEQSGKATFAHAAGGPRYAVLVALADEHATLQVGAQRFEITLAALASVWRGEFATYWRTPPGWREGTDGATSPLTRAWIEQQLAAGSSAGSATAGTRDGAASGPAGAPTGRARTLRERVAQFQIVQGLPPDGLAGPLTLMGLSRAAGVAEPQLEPQPQGERRVLHP